MKVKVLVTQQRPILCDPWTAATRLLWNRHCLIRTNTTVIGTPQKYFTKVCGSNPIPQLKKRRSRMLHGFQIPGENISR